MKVIARLAALTISALLPNFGVSAASDIEGIVIQLNNGARVLQLPLISGIDSFEILASPNLNEPFSPVLTPIPFAFKWQDASPMLGSQFFQVRMVPKSPNEVLAATLMHRVGYGPSPDDLDRIKVIGPDAYLAEQMEPEKIQEDLDLDRVNFGQDEWQFVSVTGLASSSTIYIYLTSPGDCYIDDLSIVRGPVPLATGNMVRNGGFESGLANWIVSTNLSRSSASTAVRKSGNNSLHVIATSPGQSRDSAIYQENLGLTQSQIYTLSYWYKQGTNKSNNLVVRLSGSGIVATPDNLVTRLEKGAARLEDLRAWHVLRAIQSKKQLLEVLLQWLENHFVTQHRKSREYLDERGYSGDEADQRAARMEYMENKLWRQALLKPQCTFYDLLKISAESPAMIIYLDTVNSRGSGGNIANENYARELLELFTFGVDNGYEQSDITTMSRAWTGWSIRLVHPTNEFNPFAPQSTKLKPGETDATQIENLEGVWAFAYKANNHSTASKTMFNNAVVPARFGAPYAGRSYVLSLPARSGTNSVQDGYQVIAHLANQPFTQEYISVKLCRLFVHDDFAPGYDFTDPNLSPEGKLVRECMRAWEENNPKGQIRKVLEVIFNSELFRAQAASAQKIKNPFEFTVSSIRALRALASDGSYTANTDGISIYAPMNRMGRMRLFDRDDPDGYPESAAPWISAGTLAERLRFIQSYLTAVTQSGREDAGLSYCDPVKLLKTKLPSTQWNNAEAVAGYFTSILFAGEGRANLDQYRAQAISFLNTGDDGRTSSPLANLSNTSVPYDTRIRGMAAMLMTLQRFQEQ